jgi:ATP-binding cassette subfamily B protein
MTARPEAEPATGVRQFFGVFRYSRRAIELVWSTSRWLTLAFALLTLVAGVLPAAVAWVGQLIVDAVVAGIAVREQTGDGASCAPALRAVARRGPGSWRAMAAVTAGASGSAESLLRAMLGHRVNVMILEKALTLQLSHFEDSEFYDKLTRARREASTRPLSLVTAHLRARSEQAISLTSYAGLLCSSRPGPSP